jgi:hypothetical protein
MSEQLIFKKDIQMPFIAKNLEWFNLGKSAASFCLQVAAWVSDMFSNVYLMKNHKIAGGLTTTEAREKNTHIFGILRILGIFEVCLTKFKNNQIFLI